MKKVITVLLSLTLLCTGITVFAENKETVTTSEGSANFDVNATYGETVATKYSVDITWGSMEFTYNVSGKEWDPVSHTYNNPQGTWSPSTATNSNKITVTNHSNAEVNVSFSFGGAAQGVNGTFKKIDGSGITNTKLGSADSGESLGNPNKAPSVDAYLYLSGSISSTGKVGEVTVTISGDNVE